MSELSLPRLLQTIQGINLPIGAAFLSNELAVPPATIGRMLKAAEEAGYLKQISNKGRVLTEQGRAYLQQIALAAQKEQIARDLIDTTKCITPAQLLEILQVRRLLEPYAAAEACRRASPAQVAEIEDLSFEQWLVIRKGELGSEQDLQLHLKLAELSGNAAIHQIIKLLLTENDVYVCFSSMSEKMQIQQLTRHDDIIRAMKDGKPEEAALAMEQHLERIFNNVKAFAQT